MDDQTAISLLKQGNLDGLEVLVVRYQQKCVYSAYLILQNRAYAEDVVQEAFLKAYRKIYQFSANRPFYPWFIRIVINDALKAAHKRKIIYSQDVDLDDDARQFAAWLRSPDMTMDDQVALKEDINALRLALQRLTAEERAVVAMRYYLEMSEAEIAAQCHKPLSTIKWRLHSARQRLHKILNPSSITEE